MAITFERTHFRTKVIYWLKHRQRDSGLGQALITSCALAINIHIVIPSVESYRKIYKQLRQRKSVSSNVDVSIGDQPQGTEHSLLRRTADWFQELK